VAIPTDGRHSSGSPPWLTYKELFLTVETTPAIDAALARCLVDTQLPQWAELPLRLLAPAGSDHVIYRLGEELSVRLPRHAGATKQARKKPVAAPACPAPASGHPCTRGGGRTGLRLSVAMRGIALAGR
jgi:hypothetical protein